MIRKIGILLILLLLSIVGTQAQIIDGAYNPLILEHDGLERMAHIYEPDGDINAVMIALHGFYSSGRAMETLTGLNQVADERGWVIVYPETSDAYWDDGRVEAGLPPVDNTVDDVGYLATLSDSLRANYEVDAVYLTGLALGGSMAMRAVCETPEKYDAVAIVSALMWSYQAQYCENTGTTARTNMIFIHGEQDHIYWKEGRRIESLNLDIMSAEVTIAFWGEHNGCDQFANTTIEASSLILGQNCDENATLAYLSIVGGGNNWASMANNSLNRTGIDTAQLIAGFFSEDEDWEDLTIQNEEILEVPRSYTLYIPTSYDPSTETPVILSLHGLGANTFSQASSSGFNQLAEQYGFIVIYPQAYDTNYNDPESRASWNYNLGTSMLTPHEHDDDAFLDNIVDDIAQTLSVDMNRLYVNGLSNGGYMVNHLACTRGNRYAAFAAVAANAPYGIHESCGANSEQNAPIMFYHGTADRISPWDGAPASGRDIYILAPIPNSLVFWLNNNDCGQGYEQSNIDSTDPDSSVIYVRYTECPDDAAVELYAVVDGGHLWPGVEDFYIDFLGENNMDVNASEAIWDFYSRYSLDGSREADTNFDIPINPPIISSGVPQIPLTLAQLEATNADAESSPEAKTVEALQAGGFIIYLAHDFSETFDCEADTINTDLLAMAEDKASTFGRMNVTIGTVAVLDDCRAIAVGEHLTEDNSEALLSFDSTSLATVLSTPAQEGTLTLVIGGTEEISTELADEITENQSVIFIPLENGYDPIALIPANGWSNLADAYQAGITSD